MKAAQPTKGMTAAQPTKGVKAQQRFKGMKAQLIEAIEAQLMTTTKTPTMDKAADWKALKARWMDFRNLGCFHYSASVMSSIDTCALMMATYQQRFLLTTLRRLLTVITNRDLCRPGAANALQSVIYEAAKVANVRKLSWQ